MKELIVATCQFPIGSDITENANHIIRQIEEAHINGADIAHFSENSLSGYPGIDFITIENQNIKLLDESLGLIQHQCKRLGIWAIVGSHAFEEPDKPPFNCLWIIDQHGKRFARYDKRILFENDDSHEYRTYRPGTEPLVFKIKNVLCGLLICHEWRYPELYRQYKQSNTELIFQSWYDGKLNETDYQTKGEELGSLILGSVRGYAANNYLWISGSNTSAKESCFGSFVIRPDGKVTNQIERNKTGVLITHIDFSKKYDDPSACGRERIRNGQINICKTKR